MDVIRISDQDTTRNSDMRTSKVTQMIVPQKSSYQSKNSSQIDLQRNPSEPMLKLSRRKEKWRKESQDLSRKMPWYNFTSMELMSLILCALQVV
jgi:hypothetical protein